MKSASASLKNKTNDVIISDVIAAREINAELLRDISWSAKPILLHKMMLYEQKDAKSERDGCNQSRQS